MENISLKFHELRISDRFGEGEYGREVRGEEVQRNSKEQISDR